MRKPRHGSIQTSLAAERSSVVICSIISLLHDGSTTVFLGSYCAYSLLTYLQRVLETSPSSWVESRLCPRRHWRKLYHQLSFKILGSSQWLCTRPDIRAQRESHDLDKSVESDRRSELHFGGFAIVTIVAELLTNPISTGTASHSEQNPSPMGHHLSVSGP